MVKFCVRNLGFVKINDAEEQIVKNALNICSASSVAPVDFDGIPSRSPTPAERMVADRKAPPWYTEHDKRHDRKRTLDRTVEYDTADYLKTLVCPL